MTGTTHLLIGPVGAGKTTFGRALQRRSPAVFLDLDTWMVRLFGEDQRPPTDVIAWYLARRERCRALIWDTAEETRAAGADVILELGLVGAEERREAYARAVTFGALAVHLLDAPRAERRERVARRNEHAGPYTQIVPPAFFDDFSDFWEPPDDAEMERWDITAQSSSAPPA